MAATEPIIVDGLAEAVLGMVTIIRHEFPEGWSMLKIGETVGLPDDQLRALIKIDEWIKVRKF